jgi:hypothetical protein
MLCVHVITAFRTTSAIRQGSCICITAALRVRCVQTYSKEVDGFTLKANQALVRSIPLEHKQSIKKYMTPLGFTGFKLDELTPNRTRRAQVCSCYCVTHHLVGKVATSLQKFYFIHFVSQLCMLQ